MAIKSFIKVWMILAKNILQNQLLTPSSSFLFILGKLFNFIFSIFIITAIFHQSSSINGYSLPQGVMVVLIFNLIDSTTQFFFRALYTFRPILVRGDFDLDLLKPLPAFFRPIFSGPDFLDLPIVIIKIIAFIYFIFYYHFQLNFDNSLLFSLVLINAYLMAFAIHLSIAAFSILTTEIDNLVAVYRSLGQAAVIPTDIYSGFFRVLLDYIIPVTVMFTLPAKAFLGLLTPSGVIYSCLFAYGGLIFSLWFWRFSLRRYTSASS